MRINVYAEELSADCEVIEKVVEGRKFYGIRMYLLSAPELHRTTHDDDRSAITFWVPWHEGCNHHDELQICITALMNCAKEAEMREAQL